MADQRDAIERLFLRHVRGVGSFVLARVGDPELAEEITSRVFLQVVRKFHQLRGSPAAWLWAIVRNEIALSFRTRRVETLSPDATVVAGVDPLVALESCDERERLRNALEALPEPTQQLVYMKFFLELPHEEIAAATGLSVANVGVRLFRTMRELRKRLESPAMTEAHDDRAK